MKFLFASDSLKGTLSSGDTGRLLAKAAKEVFPACICEDIPVADGGEGTVDAVIRAVQGQQIRVKAQDPLMQTRETYYGKLDENRAIIEMALASGYALVPAEKRNPLYTSSYGTGELIRDALDRGFRDITIAIGGSASAPLAIGSQAASGALTFGPGADPAAVTAAIRQAAAAAPVWLQDLLISLALEV